MKKYSIKEVSDILQVPKSTLRYWESQKLIQCEHNYDNEYREYTTDDIIEISDILFYRELNIAVKDLKHIYNLSFDDHLKLLQNSYDELESKIANLNETKAKVSKRIESLKTCLKLMDHEEHLSSPPFEQIDHMHFSQKKNVIPYLHDQSILSLVLTLDDKETSTFGIAANERKKTDNTLWQKNSNLSYLPCLIKVKNREIDYSYVHDKVKSLENQGYRIEHIIGHYFVSDKDSDYYECWIEYNHADN